MKVLFAFFTTFVLFSTTSFAANITTILNLPKMAQYHSLLFNESKIWTGYARFMPDNPIGNHQVIVIDPDDIDNPVYIKIPHSPQYIYSYEPGKVIVLGLSAYGTPATWTSHFSIIEKINGEYTVKTHTFPNGYNEEEDDSFPKAVFVKQFSRYKDHIYFSLRYGENAIMEYFEGNDPIKLKPRVIMPDKIIATKNNLYAIQKDYIDNVIKINLSTQTSDKLFKANEEKTISNMLLLEKQNILAVNEQKAVLLVNPQNLNILNEVPIKGIITGLAQYGSCLVVTTTEDRKVHFIDLTDNNPSVFKTWDINLPKNEFCNAESIAVDKDGDRFFVRSTYFCKYCQSSPNKVIMLKGDEGGLRTRCF